jgi:hypothetical protein
VKIFKLFSEIMLLSKANRETPNKIDSKQILPLSKPKSWKVKIAADRKRVLRANYLKWSWLKCWIYSFIAWVLTVSLESYFSDLWRGEARREDAWRAGFC